VKISKKRWQLRQRIRIERVSGVGSWQNNGKKGIRLFKEDFMCETGITTVLKSVARIRLVETATY
jgi:hypothetical protein